MGVITLHLGVRSLTGGLGSPQSRAMLKNVVTLEAFCRRTTRRLTRSGFRVSVRARARARARVRLRNLREKLRSVYTAYK